ncbi:MAG: hypothetical protein ACI95C_002427 [Pseudohongiellaceae bacterium]|jgi:hypothetical protein
MFTLELAVLNLAWFSGEISYRIMPAAKTCCLGEIPAYSCFDGSVSKFVTIVLNNKKAHWRKRRWTAQNAILICRN